MKIDLNKEEKLLTPQEASRSPSLTSRASFIQEKNFHLTAYSDLFGITNEFVDFNYKNSLYGKVDKNLISIYPKSEFLTQVPNISENIFLINFVTDALVDFLTRWNSFKINEKIFDDGVIFNLTPKTGYQDVQSSYEEFMSIHSEKFINFIRSKNYKSKIKNLLTFINVFSKFINVHTPILPFTMSSFSSSKFFDVRGSGLVIDFSSDEKNSDKNKINKWIKSPNFQLFKNTLEYYGFSIEKNTPWRVVANINSIPLKKYMDRYQIKENNLFNLYFNKINLIEIEIYKNFIINNYKTFIEKEPSVLISKSEICNSKVIIEKSIIKRSSNLILEDEVWNRLYLFSRFRESNSSMTQEEFEQILRNQWRLQKNLDLESSMHYVEKKISKRKAEKIKNRNFDF